MNYLSTQEPNATPAERRRERLRHLWQRATLTGPDYPSRAIARRRTFWQIFAATVVFGSLSGLAVVYSIDLPQMEDLARYRPNTTTLLLDARGNEIGSFALERRVVVPYTDIPANLKNAIISIEDKSFDHNWGINLYRAAGAAYNDIHSGSRAQGSSTLTMQLARNLFLSTQKTYSRKLAEIFLTVQIERRFTKEQIMALYVNQIYLGHGRYGFEAGSEFYFSKHLKDITLAEAALLAALPKGPELYSPIRNPERALRRRNLVLNELMSDGKITPEQAAAAKAEPLGLKIEVAPNSVAPYFIEEVRKQLEKEYGAEEVHGAGLRVYTTLDVNLQNVANKAILDGTARYERRHGWKGDLQNVIAGGLDPETYRHPDWTAKWHAGDYVHGMVTAVSPRSVTVKLGQQSAVLTPADWVWTQHNSAESFLKRGDLVYVRVEETSDSGLGGQADFITRASLQQDSGVQGSMMALDNSNGEVLAMVGGRDFALSQFNRATQSQRQVGSSFKIYDYTAAMEDGMKPYDTVVDAPTSFMTAAGTYYTPHNYEPNFAGRMSLVSAFAQSRNIPALKLADKVGIKTVIALAHRFGITSEIPAFLPIAIGAADITLAEQVGAYSVFPNDGIRIEPHYIRRVTQADGVPLDTHNPTVREVISVDIAREMMVLLQAVTHQGTGAEATSALGGHPTGGKTGTTNDFTDAWFLGFTPSVTCGTWIGFDDRQSLGKGEQGAKAALPMWIDFMKAAIVGKENETFPAAGASRKQLAVKPADSSSPDSAPSEDTPDPSDPDTTPTPDTPAPPPQLPAKPAAPIVRQTPDSTAPATGVSRPPPE